LALKISKAEASMNTNNTPAAPPRNKRNRESSGTTPSPSARPPLVFTPSEFTNPLVLPEIPAKETSKMTMDEKLEVLNKKLDALIDGVQDLQKLKGFDIKISQAELKIRNQQKELDSMKEANRSLHQKIVDLEMHSRRNNLKLFGVQDKPNEPWDETKAIVNEIFFMAGCRFNERTIEHTD